MSNIEENINNYNFTPPEKYIEKLDTLTSQLPHIMEDFQKYYVFYNKNPENNEYKRMFENIKGNIHSLNSQLFTTTNEVQSNTEKINKVLLVLNHGIKKEKEKNKELRRKLGLLENENNTTDEMISNYNQMYDIKYLHNWGLFLSIIFAGFIIVKTFKNSPVSTTA